MTEATDKPGKKKGKLAKLLLIGGGATALLGGGAGAGLYFAKSTGTPGLGAEARDLPKLVLKGEEEKAKEGEAKEAEGHKAEGGAAPAGGAKYASSYYQIEKEFTSNLKDSAHFVQVGLAVSTNYDSRVIKNVEANELAVRSAVLMTLSDTDEMQIFTPEGKRQLQKRLVVAINQVLTEKEGFGGIGNVYFTNFIVQ